ncbi:MAG: NAD(P)-dependent oxidoreductase, partial [Proteobacteria bacterium]|nr:NAD(P)-dependent oxidoreductase [Pseudomonadota bacterium]
MTENVAFLGLGVMGYPIAGHLAEARYKVTVYNRTGGRARDWLREYGATGKGGHQAAETPREAALGADIVFACVGADKDVRSVTIGLEGAFSSIKEGAVFVDHTTTSAELPREL